MSLVFQPKGDGFNLFRCLLLESSVPATLSFTLKNLMVLNFWCWILSTAFTEESFLLRARQNSMLYLSKENEFFSVMRMWLAQLEADWGMQVICISYCVHWIQIPNI